MYVATALKKYHARLNKKSNLLKLSKFMTNCFAMQIMLIKSSRYKNDTNKEISLIYNFGL